MRCLKVLPLLLLGIMLTLVWSIPTSRASGKISVILDPWPPFTLGETGGPPTSGLLVDVASELFRRAGIPYQITIYPWNRCLASMTADGTMQRLLGLGGR